MAFKPPPKIDARQFAADLNEAAGVVVEGTSYPRALLEETEGLHDDRLVNKCKCPSHLRAATCDDGARCRMVHFVWVGVLHNGDGKQWSAGRFTPSAGLLHFSGAGGYGRLCDKTEQRAGCPYDRRCTFLHRGAVDQQQRKAAQELLANVPPQAAKAAAAAPPAAARDGAAAAPLPEVRVKHITRAAVVHPDPRLVGIVVPRLMEPHERRQLAASLGAAWSNYTLAPLDLMARSCPSIDIGRVTHGLSRKWTTTFPYPSEPADRFRASLDPIVDNETHQRAHLFLFGDMHNRVLPFSMHTLCLRLSTDSALLPAMDSGVFEDEHTAARGPLFSRYLLANGNSALHHKFRDWIIARDDRARVAAWLKRHTPAALLQLLRLLREQQVQEGHAAPRDVDFAVLVHQREERVDMYAWSRSTMLQAAVCFERGFGELDGWDKYRS